MSHEAAPSDVPSPEPATASTVSSPALSTVKSPSISYLLNPVEPAWLKDDSPAPPSAESAASAQPPAHATEPPSRAILNPEDDRKTKTEAKEELSAPQHSGTESSTHVPHAATADMVASGGALKKEAADSKADAQDSKAPLRDVAVEGENTTKSTKDEHTQDDETVSVTAPPSTNSGGSTTTIGLSVDTDNSDADSALGDVWRPTSSMSVTSSVYEFVEEHGRTFHRYKQGKYFLPNDVQEQDRLDLQHYIALQLFGGKLALAPIENPGRVLDIGTGTGIWATDFATQYPASDVLGTDLSPIQPAYVPPNCRFEIDDAEDEWVWSQKFDYVHARYMVGALGKFQPLFKNIYDNMNPGGYIEFQDYVAKLEAIDNTLEGTALQHWNNLLLEGVTKIGRSGLSPLSYKKWMREAGFVDVTEVKFKVPGNAWAKGNDMKVLGNMQMNNILEGIHGMSIGLFTKFMGMSTEEVEILLVDVRKDLKNKHIHFYYPVMSVYGRKPL